MILSASLGFCGFSPNNSLSEGNAFLLSGLLGGGGGASGGGGGAEGDGDDSECELVGDSMMGELMGYPHSRQHCPLHDFRRTPHANHCTVCYCFICDCLVSECGSWAQHCSASDRDTESKRLRAERRADAAAGSGKQPAA